VLAVQTFRTVDEVNDKANNTPYPPCGGPACGRTRAASVFVPVHRGNFNLTSKLRAGVVWANTYNKFDPTSPFGGYKESGYGREGGVHGLGAYLNLN
jgi:aldehyde dehydrogenase (NAD+)